MLELSVPLMLHCVPLLAPRSTIQEPNFAAAKSVSLDFLPDVHTKLFDMTTIPKLDRGNEVDVLLLPCPPPIARVAGLSTPSAVAAELIPHGMSKCNSVSIVLRPTSTAPFPLSLTSSERTEPLAMIHNDLLYRISKELQFIGEVDEDVEKFEQLKEEIRFWVEQFGPRKATKEIWMKFPGAAACFLVLAGIYEYSHGEYWDLALRAIGVPCTPQYQRYWGQRFLWYILAFGLNPFDESGLRYVGPILGHAMVPNDCLPELFGQLLEPAVRSPAWTGLSAQELIATWLSHPASFAGVDKPVWQFLRYGGQAAEEFVSEAMRMMRQWYNTGLIPPACEVMLPIRIIQRFKIWLEQQPEPPSPRSPFLRLDPYSGIRLSFPEQRLPADRAGQICAWEVSVASRRLRGPRDYAQGRGEEAVFSVPEIPVPPDDLYEILLVVGEETVGAWSLEGMSSRRPWKAFSGKNCKALDVSSSLSAEPTWITIPESGTVIVRDFVGIELADVVKQLCYLAEDWMGYKAIEVSLSAAATFEVRCGNCVEVVNVVHPEGEVAFNGGDLLENAEDSPDNICLFGDTPPKVVLRTKPGEESDSLDNVRIRIAGHGTKGSHTRDLFPVDLSSVSQMGAGQIVIDLRQVIPLELCPGELTIILWYHSRRLPDLRFRWVHGLWWEWNQDGRAVTVHLPEGATLFAGREERGSEPFVPANGCHTAALPEGHHDIDLVLSWQRSGLPPFSVPLRLHGPRWAFLRQPSDTPVWQVAPVEMLPENLLNEDSPCVLLEVRDITWREAELRAQWIGYAKEEPTVDLGSERFARNNRWLIRLAPIADTLRKFQHTDSHIMVEGTTSGSHEARDVQICVIRLLTPTMFQWSFQLEDSSSLEWSEVCIDVDLEDLIDGDLPHLLFEARGGRWVDAEVRACWQPLDQTKPSRMLSPESCAEPGRWCIDLAPVVKFIEESPMKASEVWFEAETSDIQGEDQVKMTLIRIHQHPVSLRTYDDCIQWAEGKRLRLLALDLLCDLSYKHWAPVGLLALDWKTSSELVRRALRIVIIECPEVTLTERQNTYAMSKETYRRMRQVLNDWDQRRWWKE